MRIARRVERVRGGSDGRGWAEAAVWGHAQEMDVIKKSAVWDSRWIEKAVRSWKLMDFDRPHATQGEGWRRYVAGD